MVKATVRKGPRTVEGAATEVGVADQAAAPGPSDLDGRVATFIASIPGYSSKPSKAKTIMGGVSYETMEVTFGDPVRSMVIRRLDVADEWDLAEVAGTTGGNEQWLLIARAAAAVITVDGAAAFPGSGGMTRRHLRGVMQTVGTHGINAAIAAMAGLRAPLADDAAIAGNS